VLREIKPGQKFLGPEGKKCFLPYRETVHVSEIILRQCKACLQVKPLNLKHKKKKKIIEFCIPMEEGRREG
jgi:hypothetical protein